MNRNQENKVVNLFHQTASMCFNVRELDYGYNVYCLITIIAW